MNLPRAQRFEDIVRFRIRSEIAKDPKRWAEYKRRKKRNNTAVPPWFMQTVFPFFILFKTLQHEGRPIEVVCLGLTLMSTANGMVRAGGLIAHLYSSVDVRNLLTLPLADERFAKLQFWRIALRSALFILYAIIVMYMPAGNTVLSFKAILGLAVLVWLASWLVTAIALRWPVLMIHWSVPFGLWGLGYVVLLVPDLLPAGFFAYEQWLRLLSPTGWIATVFQRLHEGNASWFYYLAAPVLLAPIGWKLLTNYLRDFRSHEIVINNQGEDGVVIRSAQQLLLPASSDAPGIHEARDDTSKEDLDQIANGLLDKGAGERLAWETLGPVERIVAAWLSPRERVVVELLEGGKPEWGSTVLSLLLRGTLLIGLILLFPQFPFLLWIGLIFIGPKLLVGLTTWPGLRWLPCGGKFIPLYAAYPIGFTEMSRIMLVVNGLRCALHMPIAMALGACVLWAHGKPPQTGALYATIITAQLMAAQPFLIAAHIINLNSYLSLIKGETLPLLFLTLFTAGVWLGTTFWMVMDPGESIFFGTSSTLATSALFWYIVKYSYNSGFIELLRETNMDSTNG